MILPVSKRLSMNLFKNYSSYSEDDSLNYLLHYTISTHYWIVGVLKEATSAHPDIAPGWSIKLGITGGTATQLRYLILNLVQSNAQ